MPYYDYRCKECGHEFNKFGKIAERNIPVESACPACSKESTVELLITGTPPLADPLRVGVQKVPDGFKDVLRHIDANSPGSQIKKSSSFL